jgi:hypothetical protein
MAEVDPPSKGAVFACEAAARGGLDRARPALVRIFPRCGARATAWKQRPNRAMAAVIGAG